MEPYIHQKEQMTVSKAAVILVIIFSISCGKKENLKNSQRNNDFIVNSILKKKLAKGDTIYLIKNNDNLIVIDLIQKMKNIEVQGDLWSLDSLRTSIGLFRNNDARDNIYIDEIFNRKHFDYLIQQKHVGFWKDLSYGFLADESRNSKIKKVSISMPIYTMNDKFALIGITTSTSSYILIYENNNSEWKESKLIAPMVY